MSFEIQKIDRSRAQQVEPLGSKPKFWFCEGNQQVLFKGDDRGTGEDWAEVIASHLCDLIGLPHVAYSLAAEYEGEEYRLPGVVCLNMVNSRQALLLGNQFLLQLVPGYPSDQRYHVQQHTVDAVCKALSLMGRPTAAWADAAQTGLSSALDFFVGYVLLDVWIANQDRHHENWGAIYDLFAEPRMSLAPTFDHGASLGRNLRDTERQERLTTNDENRSVGAFAKRGRSAIYESASDSKPMLLLDLFCVFAQRAPHAAKVWIDRLETVTETGVWDIVDQVPDQRMSDVCREFTVTLLNINRHRVLQAEVDQ